MHLVSYCWFNTQDITIVCVCAYTWTDSAAVGPTDRPADEWIQQKQLDEAKSAHSLEKEEKKRKEKKRKDYFLLLSFFRLLVLNCRLDYATPRCYVRLCYVMLWESCAAIIIELLCTGEAHRKFQMNESSVAPNFIAGRRHTAAAAWMCTPPRQNADD